MSLDVVFLGDNQFILQIFMTFFFSFSFFKHQLFTSIIFNLVWLESLFIENFTFFYTPKEKSKKRKVNDRKINVCTG